MIRKQPRNYCVIKKLKLACKPNEQKDASEQSTLEAKIKDSNSKWTLQKEDKFLVNDSSEFQLIESF